MNGEFFFRRENAAGWQHSTVNCCITWPCIAPDHWNVHTHTHREHFFGTLCAVRLVPRPVCRLIHECIERGQSSGKDVEELYLCYPDYMLPRSGGVSGRSSLWNTAPMVGSPATLWRHSRKYSQGCGHKVYPIFRKTGRTKQQQRRGSPEFSLSGANPVHLVANVRICFSFPNPVKCWRQEMMSAQSNYALKFF